MEVRVYKGRKNLGKTRQRLSICWLPHLGSVHLKYSALGIGQLKLLSIGFFYSSKYYDVSCIVEYLRLTYKRAYSC